MKNQTPKTQQLAIRFPFIVAYGTYMESATHTIVAQLWKAEYHDAPTNIISISNEGTVSVDSVDQSLQDILLALVMAEAKDVKPTTVKRSKAITIDLESEDMAIAEIDFSTMSLEAE